MSKHCTQPVSWLRLERYALHELAAAHVGAVEAHLASCEVCAECLANLREDERALPALPIDFAAMADSARSKLRRQFRWLVAATGFAVAAVALLLIFRTTSHPGHAPYPSTLAVKGGDLAIELVRERDGSAAYEPTSFSDADRFKVLLTCPFAGEQRADVVVYQGGEVFFPLEATTIRCGNRVALPGAFRLDGTAPAMVCATASTGDRQPELSRGPDGHKNLVCVSLEAAPIVPQH